MAEKIELTEPMLDELADIVVRRYVDAWNHKNLTRVYSELTIAEQLRRADRQIRKQYTPEQRQALQEIFGPTCALKYDSITQEKVEAVTDWYSDLFLTSLDKVFTIKPTPEPELDEASKDKIREEIKIALWKKMQEAGVNDPQLLMLPNGQPSPQLKGFLEEQIRALRKIEQTRILALAQDSADIVANKMRDIVVEGNFRQNYSQYRRDCFLYGIGIIQFPFWQRKRVLKHSGKRGRPAHAVKPTFRRISPHDFFPSPEATRDIQTCLGVTERRLVTRIDLIHMANQKEYRGEAIADLLEEYQMKSRGWLPSQMDFHDQWVSSYWGPDETITVLIHEGYFTGSDMEKLGITGIKTTDYVNARIEVCGRRTIRAELLKAPFGNERSYYGVPLSITGDGFWDTVGIAARVADTEARINVIMHTAIDNMDWAARPPVMTDSDAFKNPNDAKNIVPGRRYEVNDQYTNNNVPDPIRPMKTVSAQYHMLITEANVLKKRSDDESGIPAYAYGQAEYGRASLGEFAQRMSNALRAVKGAARKEDEYFVEPAFETLFRYLMETEKDLAIGADLECVVRGMAGLLEESKQQVDKQTAIPIAVEGNQMGVVSEDVVKVAFREALKEYGIPVDAISPDDDPLVNRAMSLASGGSTPNMGGSGASPMTTQQVPQLDARSTSGGALNQTMASPSGASPGVI